MKQKIDIWPNRNTKVDPRDLKQASKHKSNWATTRKKADIGVSACSSSESCSDSEISLILSFGMINL